MVSPSPLGLDPADLASCVQCGLCLPHCPTWRVSGEEARSPRGRIDAMRDVEWRGAPLDPGFVESMESCVGCRGCETACPSAVPFGRLMDQTRSAMVERADVGYLPRWRRLPYRALTHPGLLRLAAAMVAVAQRAGFAQVLRRRGVPSVPLRNETLSSTGDDVVLVTGCVMDVVQRDVHAAALRVLGAAGVGVALQPSPGCCGALASHAGLSRLGRAQLSGLIDSLPPDVPIVVDSAGCSAQLKEAGHLLDTAAAREVAGRVRDLTEVLADRAEALAQERDVDRPRARVAIQDPCHLRHVQRVHGAVRTALAPFVDVIELDDDGLCCGAGGAFSFERPAEAAKIRERKLASIARSGAPVVASANPGCSMHLAAAGLTVVHPVQLIDDALGRAPD